MIKAISSFLLCMVVFNYGITNSYASTVNRFGMFDTVEIKSSKLTKLPQWQEVLSKIDVQKEEYIICENAKALCQEEEMYKWRYFIRQQRNNSPELIIEEVNRFVNEWQYITDLELWGKSDYWASPSEFLPHSGDCEDYAIVKYATLKELLPDDAELRLVVLKDKLRNINHAVLSVKFASEPDKTYILDNLYPRVMEEAELTQYKPYYSVNESYRWVHLPPIR